MSSRVGKVIGDAAAKKNPAAPMTGLHRSRFALSKVHQIKKNPPLPAEFSFLS
jgi:hypothetical protein